MLHFLLIEGQDPTIQKVIQPLLDAGFTFQYECIHTEHDYLDRLTPELDLILCACSSTHFDVVTALHHLRARALEIPFILIARPDGESFVQEAIKLGLTDCLFSDRLGTLALTVTNALRIS